MIDLNSSTEALQEEFGRLADTVVIAESERRQIWAELTRRRSEAEAQVAASKLSPEARAVLKGIL